MSRSAGAARPQAAVVGAGVAGLTAAYLLQRAYDVTLYEADGRLGGHAHTHDIASGDGRLVSLDTLTGPVNATAPHPVRNADYARTLARVLRRPLQLPVPGPGPRLLLGEQGASELAGTDQRVSPERLLRDGHRFRHLDLELALRHLLGRAHPGAEDS